jgi:hypothetical protein
MMPWDRRLSSAAMGLSTPSHISESRVIAAVGLGGRVTCGLSRCRLRKQSGTFGVRCVPEGSLPPSPYACQNLSQNLDALQVTVNHPKTSLQGPFLNIGGRHFYFAIPAIFQLCLNIPCRRPIEMSGSRSRIAGRPSRI